MAKSHELFAEMIPAVLKTLKGLLTSDDVVLQEKGIHLWSDLQQKRFHQQAEAKRLHGEQAEKIMKHLERMAGVTDEGGGESPYAAANRRKSGG